MKRMIRFDRAPALRIEAGNRCALSPVPPEAVIRFPVGLPGFEQIKNYVLMVNEDVKPFLFLQALDKTSLSFVCVEPFLICPDYAITIPRTSATMLQLDSSEDAAILSLVTLGRNVQQTTANLMGPVVVNLKKMIAQQIILEDESYPVRYRIWDALHADKAARKAG